MLRVLIADDEPIALQRLELAARCIPDLELIGSARNGRQAIEFIRGLKPDIALLDILMPGMDGFAVIDALRPAEHLPEIIFVTAFHEHAVRAFDVHAVDYLLKPVEFERFQLAIVRARMRLAERTSDRRFSELQALLATLRDAPTSTSAGYEQSLWIRTREGLSQIPVDSIEHISADGDYVMLHHANGASLLKDTISSLQSRLDPSRFMRVHRSAIVNVQHVRALRRRGPRSLSVALASGAQVAVGPSYINDVLRVTKARRWR